MEKKPRIFRIKGRASPFQSSGSVAKDAEGEGDVWERKDRKGRKRKRKREG